MQELTKQVSDLEAELRKLRTELDAERGKSEAQVKELETAREQRETAISQVNRLSAKKPNMFTPRSETETGSETGSITYARTDE